MSHFPVLVISKSEDEFEITKLLADYDENIEYDPYIKYTREEAIEYVRKENAEMLAWHKQALEKEDNSSANRKHHLHWYNIRKERESWTDEQCYEDMHKDYPNTDSDGNLLSTYNPNSKWDWWVIGGRFSCEHLRDKNTKEYTDEIWARDLDAQPDPEEYETRAKWWNDWVEDGDPTLKEQVTFDYSPEWYKETYGDKETYALINSLPIFRAVVTPDGVWHEKGTVGWFGMSYETPEESLDWDVNFMERFITPAIKNDCFLTVVDCHI